MQTPNYSLVAIFEAIAANEKITRREIAETTGFSQVTVGKAVDTLHDAGIVIRNKKEADGVGRKGDICKLNKNHGMMLFDMSEAKIRMVICDIGLDILCEATSDDLSELVMMGLSKTAEFGFESVPVIGCICKKGEEGKAAKAFTGILGNTPDVICPASHAGAYVNYRRFGCGNGIFARIFSDGDGYGAIMADGAVYTGANGNAGTFSRGEEAEAFVTRICELGAALDTEIIHIACDDILCGKIKSVTDAFFADSVAKPEIAVESVSDCPDIIIGLAYAVRNKLLFSLTAK